jgi:hypothetical protein
MLIQSNLWANGVDLTVPHKVGDKVQVSMSGGKIVDATIKAVLDGYTDGVRYQVDFGKVVKD